MAFYRIFVIFTLQMETEALVIYSRDWQTFSIKGQIAIILGFMGLIVSVTTPQVSCRSLESAAGDT